MNLSTKQAHRHTKQTHRCQGRGELGRDGLGVWDQQMQTLIYRMDGQQSPTAQGTIFVSCDKPSWKIIYIYMYN